MSFFGILITLNVLYFFTTLQIYEAKVKSLKKVNIFNPEHDEASQQIDVWAKTHKKIRATVEAGAPYPSLTATTGVGKKGPLLLRDINYLNNIAAITNERIPEREVHAKAAGAMGYFKVTNPDIAKYTGAKIFSKVGKKTKLSVRFSTVGGELGSADTIRDLRGFAVKFYTEEGNYDLMMLNTMIYNLRDPMGFPAVTRTRKRNPATHLQDINMYWDYTSERPETTFGTFQVFSDLAFFKNYRVMSGFAINTFLWTRGSSGEDYFVKYQVIPTLKKSIFSMEDYIKLAGADPDYQIRDLYNSISKKKYPKYNLYVQILTKEEAKTLNFNLFDPTKMLPVKDFPLVKVGVIRLNQNPKDYFNDVEQLAFNPGNLVPGIEFSPDRVLQGRPFAYISAQRHRLGTNFVQLPINSPKGVKVRSYNRDGQMNIYGNGDGGPNYYPNTYNGPFIDSKYEEATYTIPSGTVERVDLGDEDNYSQLNDYWNDVMSEGEKKRTIRAIAFHLSKADIRIQEKALMRNFDPINTEIPARLRAELAKYNKQNRKKNKK